MREDLADRRREMVACHMQGMKVSEWTPLVALKYKCKEEALQRDWSRRRSWIHLFLELEDPSELVQRIVSDHELLLLDTNSLFEQSEDPKMKLQLMWVRLKINREKKDFLKEIGAFDPIRAKYEQMKNDLITKINRERYPYLKGNEDQNIRNSALKKAGRELPGDV